MVRTFIATCGLLTGIQTTGTAQTIRFTATADSLVLPGPQLIGTGVIGAFQLMGAVPFEAGGPNFVVVSPSSGVTPGTGVWVALNPNVVPYLGSGGYSLRLQFATPGQSCSVPTPGVIPCAGVNVILDLSPAGTPTISTVFSAATLQPAISPGELVSIFGTHLSTQPITTQYDSAGLYPTSLGISRIGTPVTTVTFNGTPAALLYVSQTQINAQVPYEVAGQKNVNVVVTHNFAPSPPFSVALPDTSPGVYTVTQNGNGPGAILNAGSGANPVSVNSADNPASKGSGISIFATGSGGMESTRSRRQHPSCS